MQKHFQRELSRTAGVQRASRKGTALRNRTRALNIARSSRSIKKLELVSTLQAGKLARFSKYGKALDSGLMVTGNGSCFRVIPHKMSVKAHHESMVLNGEFL